MENEEAETEVQFMWNGSNEDEMGYTVYITRGKTDGDPGRYGKCPRRKVQNGKLVDTNNSTNDFDRDAKPSLAK